MKNDLFKELNAHVRACDNKSLVLNTAYVATLVYVFSDTPTNNVLRAVFDDRTITEQWFNVVFLVGIAALGYAVLYAQYWFRAWKVHYLNLLHEMYIVDTSLFGDHVPVWMKRRTKFASSDNLLRNFPFFVNILVVVQIAHVVGKSWELYFWVLLFVLLALHYLIHRSLLWFGGRVDQGA